MKRSVHAAMLMSALALTLLSGTTWAEVPIVTGEHWTTSSVEQKKAYLFGMANMAQIELAYQDPNDTQSVVAKMSVGMKGQTIDSVRERLDSWYAAHPDQLQQPVIETIWFEMVVPGLQKTASGEKP